MTPSPTIGDLVAAGLEFGDLVLLVLGEHLGEHLVDAEFACDGVGNLSRIAGDHHDTFDADRVVWRSITASTPQHSSWRPFCSASLP